MEIVEINAKTRRVLKYELAYGGGELALPTGSIVVHVGEQGGKLYLWADTPLLATGTSKLDFLVVGTGDIHEFNGSHYKTVQMQSGLVWHIYLKALEDK